MDISLNQGHRERIKRKVEAGLYGSTDEAIARALDLLDEFDEELAELRAKIQQGIEQLENGQYAEYTDETLHQLFEGVKRRGRERRKTHQSSNPTG